MIRGHSRNCFYNPVLSAIVQPEFWPVYSKLTLNLIYIIPNLKSSKKTENPETIEFEDNVNSFISTFIPNQLLSSSTSF